MSALQVELGDQIARGGLGGGMFLEYRFAAYATGGTGPGVRERLREARLQDWRFDFSWPNLMTAVEVDGGTWSGGRHVRGGGYEGDCVKCNAAQAMGWRVFRYTAAMVKDGRAFAQLSDVLLPF
jgi:hypothetical protein